MRSPFRFRLRYGGIGNLKTAANDKLPARNLRELGTNGPDWSTSCTRCCANLCLGAP